VFGILKSKQIQSLAKIKQVEVILGLMSKYRNFLIYSIIGVSGATLDLVLFLILFNKFHIDKNVATAISTSLGIINNFTWNVLINFKVKDKLLKRFATFYSIGLVGLGLTIVIFYIFVDILKFNTNIVKIVSIIFVVLVQYTLNKKLSFKKA
jgi:putative flippase GtrA